MSLENWVASPVIVTYMLQMVELGDDKLTLIEVMAWCCLPEPLLASCVSPYGATRPGLVKKVFQNSGK